jgi:hypothetical protein
VRIDLLETHPEDIPPEDYLRVYHLYFNEKASEEAYEMFDPASVENITLGEWMSFHEPTVGQALREPRQPQTPLSERRPGHLRVGENLLRRGRRSRP